MKKMRISFQGLFCCFILMLSSGVPVTAGPTDPVTIPDANLRAVIETKLGKSSGDTITEAEMNGMTGQLFAYQKGIRSLTGLEHATGIGSLQLSRNSISDLSPLSGLTQLTSLNLDLNPMTDLSALKDLVNLTLLYARRRVTQANYNGPTPLDLSFLTKLTQLEYLALDVWAIRDLSVVANLTALKELYLQYNRFSDISPLSSLTALTRLDLTFNYFLTDISPLGSLTALETLHLTSNSRLSDISALKNLTNLELLWLHSTNITSDGLAEVLPSFSSMKNLILDGTRISDLSVLDHLPAGASMSNLSVRHIHDPPGATDDKGWLLKDLTPLVELMESGKLVNQNSQSRIEVRLNWNLDYDSIYTDIPALIADFSMPGVVAYSPVVPGLRRESEEHHVGSSQSRHTLSVSAYSTFEDYRGNWPGNRYTAEKVNEEFEGVPVTWKVTAPDGTVTQTQTPTGDDGLSSVTFTLGDDGEKHTVEAIVPENTRAAAEGPSHPELKVTFTARAVAPPVITLTLDNVGHTHIQWIADVSGPLPQAYVHYYKKSVDTTWIEKGNFGPMPRRFSFILSDLEPGTSYDCQLFALQGENRVEPGSNVLTARTLSRTPPRPPPEPPAPPNNPPVFTSASTVSVQENTTAVIRIVAEDPDAGDEITNYAITGGADQAMLEIGGTGTPSDMLRFKAAPDFENPQDADTDNVCILILTATSGVGDRELTATQTLAITVTDVDETPPAPPNRPPVFRSASAVNVAENTTAVITIVAEDPDAEDEITSYAITGGADQALFEIGGASSPLDMLRFKTAPDFEMPGSADNSNVYTLILTATGGVGDRELTANQTLTVTVTDVDETPPAPPNRPPVFRSASAVNVAENTTAVVTIVAEDPDTEDAITGYAITGGADASLFEIHGASTPSDMLRFKAAPDFEMPEDADTNNVYIVILTATSGVGDRELTANQTLTVTVTDVDETPANRPPVFTSASAVSVPENTTAVITVVAEDPDTEDAITGYAITGGADQALFEIGGASSPLDMLRFKAAPDFEMPGDADTNNVYIVILTATSGVGDRELTATQTLTVTVTDVDETPPEPANRPPVFRSASAVNVAENTTAVVTIIAEDPDASDAITGYAITGGADQALFELGGASSPLDMLRFKAAPDFEMPGSAANSNVYTLILTATSGVGDRALSTNQTLTVTVTDVDERPPAPVNRPPFFRSASMVSVLENTTAVVTIIAEDPDAGDEITDYTLTGGADQVFFELGGTRSPMDMLRFRAAPDFETPQDADTNNVYSVILTATSGIGARELTATQTLTVTVRDVDEPVAPPVQPPVEPPVKPPVKPPVEPPVEPPVAPPVQPPVEPPVQPPVEPPVQPPVGGGSAPAPPHPPAPLATECFIFNEISNASDDTNDWIELKNLCNVPLALSDWQIRLMASEGPGAGEAIEVVSFPDARLPAQQVLLITNTDPSETRLARGLNLRTGARQRGARHLYLVAPDLQLPSVPYLLILQRRATENGDPPATIEDVAGNYFRSVSPYATEVYPITETRRPTAAAAPLTDSGVWQRQHLEQPGYLAAAWVASGYHGGIGYDRHVEESASHGTPGYRRDPSPSLPVAHRLVFNEIRNAGDDTHDWVELKNVCGAGVRLSEWEISIVASAGEAANQDVDIVSFPDYTLPMGGVLLITNTDPSETRLAGGLNIATGARQHGAQHPYLVAPDLQLPSVPYLLILRYARKHNGTPTAIEDVAGNYFRRFRNTAVWPLAETYRPTAPAVPLTAEGTWQRRDVRERGYLAAAWTEITVPTGLGYDRHALGENAPGAPGYGAAVGFNAPLPDEVRFSELMFETEGPSRRLPQWIEVYNLSETPVNLKGWQLVVETRTAETHRDVRLTLDTLLIPPKQTVLLVTEDGRNAVALPRERIYDLSAAHPDAFSPHHLGSAGFFLKLTHPTGRVVDACGNLDGNPRTDDLPTWTLPVGETLQGHRSSLLRRFQGGDVRKGTEASGWQRAADVGIGVRHYYGHPTDISTPVGLHQIVPGASPTDALSISELLFETKIRTRPLPEWIELYNPSFTGSVNLKDYQLVVETRQVSGRHHQIVIDLEAMPVLPNQTVLLITERGRHSQHFTENRIYNLSQRHPKALRSSQQAHYLLSSEGFLIQLTDATGNVVDTVGNLDGYPFTEDTPAWTLPDGETPEGARASIRRVYEKRIPLDGRHREGWVSTAAVSPVVMTYYGHASDVGNPGYRMGGPLPVVLSSFRAVRDDAAVQVSWTTESSLENAGFHLYRSTQRKGGFIRVNPRLIQGAGTTAERRTYTYVDNPPKADGVYYYQLQEISYSGQQQVLATARIKGYLSADGKHLTTLGAVKKGGSVK